MKRVVPNRTYLRVLLTGRSGSTKTRTSYSACLDERTSPVLGLDMQGQPRSIADYEPAPDIIGIESLTDMSLIYNWLRRGQSPTDPLVKQLDLRPPYKTLVIDGFTELQKMVVTGISENTNKLPGDKPNPVQIQHYGTILAQTTALADRFFTLPMHVVATVLEQERTEGENGPTFFRHLLVGQARDQLSSYAEVVARLVHVEKLAPTMKAALKSEITADTISVAIFKPGLRHEAKDQTGRLGDVMIDPSISKILDLLEVNPT